MAKSRRRQSAQDRQRRLANGCCPIHGIGMTQVGLKPADKEQPFVVTCPRCGVSGKTFSSESAVTLDAEYTYLLNGE